MQNGVALFEYVIIYVIMLSFFFLSSDFQFSFTVDATHNIRIIFHIGVTTLSIIFLPIF